MSMDLSIIIVNYNSKAKALNCLESIGRADLAGIDYEVIVVDNNSRDGISEAIKSGFPKAKFIQSERNRGMGGGNNLGVRGAAGEYLLILNPDTMVKEDSIKTMLEAERQDPQIGLLGPKLLYRNGRLQYSCLRFPKLLTPIYRRTFLGKFAERHLDQFLMKDYDHETRRQVDWVQGSCMLIKRSLFTDLAGFDERFFMYFEDTDLCRRIRQAGFKVMYDPRAIVIHDHERASASDSWYIAPFTNRLSQIHLASWIKYFIKWKFRANL